MPCWLHEDWGYSSTCQVRSYLCLTAGPAMTQLLLRYSTTVIGASLFPWKSSWPLYYQCREFTGLQEVIALSQVPLSSSTLLIYAAMAGGGSNVQTYSGLHQCSDLLSLRKENRHRQPPPHQAFMLSCLGAMPLPPYDLQLLLKEGDGNGWWESFQNHITISYRKMSKGFSLTALTPPCMPFFLGKCPILQHGSPWGFHKVPVQVLNFWVIANLVKFAG